jgi:hypothetical protein
VHCILDLKLKDRTSVVTNIEPKGPERLYNVHRLNYMNLLHWLQLALICEERKVQMFEKDST